MLESVFLLHWAQEQKFHPLGLTGVSMGGYMVRKVKLNLFQRLFLGSFFYLIDIVIELSVINSQMQTKFHFYLGLFGRHEFSRTAHCACSLPVLDISGPGLHARRTGGRELHRLERTQQRTGEQYDASPYPRGMWMGSRDGKTTDA